MERPIDREAALSRQRRLASFIQGRKLAERLLSEGRLTRSERGRAIAELAKEYGIGKNSLFIDDSLISAPLQSDE